MKETKYENRHWELIHDSAKIIGKLHFTQFYEDTIILSFEQDANDKETYHYTSELLDIENDCIFADTIESAIEEFEYMIINHIEDEIDTLKDMLEKFKAEANN